MRRPAQLFIVLCFAFAPWITQLSAQGSSAPVGAVYAMSNDFTENAIVAYAQAADGTLSLVGTFQTGGTGASFDGGEGLDPLISAYALLATDDSRFLLAVNAGSNSVSVLRVNEDFTLTRTDERSTLGTGPNSVAYHNGVVYVTNIDADGVFTGEPDQEGNLTGFRLTREGKLQRLANSTRALGTRPAAAQFSPDGRFLVVSSINSGSVALASGSNDELVVYAVNEDGSLSQTPTGAATSTLVGNAAGRNLPTAVGFEIVEDNEKTFVVVTEAREFRPDGTPPTFATLQTGSVSTWRLEDKGTLTAVNLDVITGDDFTDGERTACWIEFSADQSYFWVTNALESTLSSFSFDEGEIVLLDRTAAAGEGPSDDDPFGTTDGWIDLWASADGNFLYQLFGLDGTVGVFAVNGPNLTLIQEATGNLPVANTQGIVAVSRPLDGAVYAMTNESSDNKIAAYGQAPDGTLTLIDMFETGGDGGVFDGGEGLDPLISAYSVITTDDNQFLLNVNAGSNSVTSFRINGDFTLTQVSEESTLGVGPNSIAYDGDLVYVSNIDADGIFAGEPDQEGNLVGFRLDRKGELQRIPGSLRSLGSRPAAIQFSPDGRFLIVASLNAGSIALASGSVDELVVFEVLDDGQLSRVIATATSTLPFNAEGRNLPTAVGFEIVAAGGAQYVVVTEAREFQSDGSPPAFAQLQTGSVSTWKLENDGTLTPIDLDVITGPTIFDGQRTACWIEFSADQSYFWVTNALESTISTFSFDRGSISLINDVEVAGTGPADGDPFGTTDGWIDLWISDNGRYLYQLFGLDGTIGVFEIDGSTLTLVEEVSGDLPVDNTQGIVAVSQIGFTPAFAGNGQDLRLRSSTGTTDLDEIDFETAEASDFVNLDIDSPGQTFVGATLLLGVDSFTTGGSRPDSSIPNVHVDGGTILLVGGSTPVGTPVVPPHRRVSLIPSPVVSRSRGEQPDLPGRGGPGRRSRPDERTRLRAAVVASPDPMT